MQPNTEQLGLSTPNALKRLHYDIENTLQQFEASQNTRANKSWIRDALHHSSQTTTFNWISASLLFITAFCFLLTYFIKGHSSSLIYESLLLFVLLIANVCIELHDNKLRHREVPNRVRALLGTIRTETGNVKWLLEHYPKLCSPYSPCITLQWTYRDNQLVNLPWALLVKGDIILVRPGQVSPGYCESLDKNSEYPFLHYRNIYGPTLQSANEIFSVPKARKPLKNQKYRLLETPYVNNLRIMLEEALNRPVTQHNQQRFLVTMRFIERVLLPVMFFLVYFVGFIKYIYLHSFIGTYSIWDLFIMVPLKCTLPLLPLVFTVTWNLLNYLGMARFKTLFDITTKIKVNLNDLEEEEQTQLTHLAVKCDIQEILRNFVYVLKGNADIMCRSANILHVLGSVTALCCVDKKGILSWPNPVAEKVFFLRNSDGVSQNSSLANLGDLGTDFEAAPPHHIVIDSPNVIVPEVLDLTHKHNDPFLLHFDDTSWKKHLNSLKPLGLAILLNTCNLSTQEHYTSFCSHITCEAMYNESLVPVTNRRCLCALAKEIGFLDEAQKIFSLEQQLSSYRHLQPEMVRRDNKYARSLQLSTKLKFPFPHMFAVVVKELASGATQLLSEGTADIVLDSCVEFWDGIDLCPLSSVERKKIQDFYQRSSLTAYCTAFAYRPLHKNINNKLSDVYLELPSDSRHLYMNHRSPTPIHWECKSVLEPRIKMPLGQFYSTDSLLYNDNQDVDISDAESCFELQCNQVFIGMVTMQYQVLTDMVHLIEQLERACIRFVHFSKENELRSRVFSEKMGLESGWNCHISLLSERTRRESDECWANNGTARVSSPINKRLRRKSQSICGPLLPASPNRPKLASLHDYSHLESSRTMSFSAPCAINVEQPTEPVQEHLLHSQHRVSEDSIQMHNTVTHDWQSLSCLTDSTEHSAPINFDMSNRAKLPRGIDKIRPHIELIDNVPLLVSLFTDCTATATKEMLHIMQDYGEVVCVIGSSANWENIGIFMQADASIALEPLYPQVCRKETPYKPTNASISPIDLARALNSVACSLSLRREDPISIYHLIMEARHFLICLWSSMQFWLCCCLTLTVMQVFAAMLLLPALLTLGQVLLFVCLIVPALSVALMGLPVDPGVMQKPLGKNQITFSFQVLVFVCWSYGLKFLPVIFASLISFMGVLSSQCADFCTQCNCTCTLFYLPVREERDSLSGWVESSQSLLFARNLVVLVVFVNFVVISMGFVHREHPIWRRGPHRNVFWLSAVFILGLLQSTYTFLSLRNVSLNLEMPLFVVLVASVSPLVTFLVNELVKYQEIQVNKRFRRRARLDFGTKLGMNSPF